MTIWSGIAAQAMDEDCRCVTLPTNGERICDPYGCDGRKNNKGKKRGYYYGCIKKFEFEFFL